MYLVMQYIPNGTIGVKSSDIAYYPTPPDKLRRYAGPKRHRLTEG